VTYLFIIYRIVETVVLLKRPNTYQGYSPESCTVTGMGISQFNGWLHC